MKIEKRVDENLEFIPYNTQASVCVDFDNIDINGCEVCIYTVNYSAVYPCEMTKKEFKEMIDYLYSITREF